MDFVRWRHFQYSSVDRTTAFGLEPGKGKTGSQDVGPTEQTLLLRSFTVKGTLKEVAGGSIGSKEVCLFLCFHSKKGDTTTGSTCSCRAGTISLLGCWGGTL